MEPTEYLVLLIDPSYLDTHSRLSNSSSRTGPALSTRAETRSNASSHSLSSSTSTSTTYSNSNSHTSSTSSVSLSPAQKNYRSPRSKSKPASASSSRSRSESRSSDRPGSLPSILRLAGLKVLISGTYEEALALLEHRPPTESRPVILLVDVDTDLVSPHSPGSFSSPSYRPITYKGSNGHNGNAVEPAKQLQVNGQRHLRATNDSTSSKGSYQRGRRTPNKAPQQNGVDDALCGLDFLETVLQGLAKGTLHHVVPVAISSTSSQDRILELFNLGVADVLVKPIEEQAAKTLFLNAHRYSKHKSAVTIPRYATQKNSLTLPSHTRLRNVFLKDQWLSDILVSHYCPTPTKISLQDFPSMSSNGAQERVEELKIRLLSWDFHPHDLCEDDLMRCVVIVIQEVMKLEGLGDLNIPEHLLHRFVVGLRDSYHRSNPYHNFAHAVDVLQATFYFLCRMGKLPLTGSGYPPLPNVNGHTGAETQVLANIPTDLTSAVDADARSRLRVQDFLRPEDIFALIVASIGHDVGHPGVNNMFLINAHTPLAQIYNDRSVLESFHSMALFQVMKKHGFECFDVDSQNRKFLEFRKMVVSTILATDMGLHFDYVGKIKEQTERIRLRGLPGGDAPKHNQASIDEQERLVLCGTLIKCADISNASRPFHVAERWCTVLLQEMCNQADIEKEMAVCSGLQPVPAGSTKSLANDRGMQIDSQLGFIHGFAMPLFGSVRDMIPEMGYCVDFLQINHQIWQDRKTDYLKNGGGSIFVPINATKACSEDEDLAEKVVPAPKMATNHGRAKTPTGKVTAQSIPSNRDGIRTGSRKGQHATESDGGQQSRGSDLVSIKPRAGNAKRSRSAAAAESSEAPASLSAIPRPRMRTKAAASDNNAQDARQNGLQRGGAVEQGSRSRLSSPREPNSRVRTVTSATTLSIPVSSGSVGPKSGYTSVKARSRPVTPTSRQQQQQQQQQPNAPVPLKQSSRGHRSPGRRSQHVKEKTNGLLNGESGPHQDQPESLVLRSPLSVSTPSLSMVATETSPSISSAEI